MALLLDAGAPWLPLCTLAGFMLDQEDPAKSVPGGGMLAGIGFVSGVRCMVVASDSGIEAGAIQEKGLDKMLRVQEIALQNRLPFIHLVESAGANLMRYKVEGFVHGGALFSLIDTALGQASHSLFGGEAGSMTLECKINYIRAVSDGEVICHAKVLNAGRKVHVLEARVLQGDKLVATAQATFICK